VMSSMGNSSLCSVILRCERSEPRRMSGRCAAICSFSILSPMSAFVYMLHCCDGSYYVGSATGRDPNVLPSINQELFRVTLFRDAQSSWCKKARAKPKSKRLFAAIGPAFAPCRGVEAVIKYRTARAGYIVCTTQASVRRRRPSAPCSLSAPPGAWRWRRTSA
jgi:hypothetical protein